MKETKYGKYIVERPKANIKDPYWEPTYKPGDILRVLTLDDEVVSGAFNIDTNWFFPSENLRGAGDGTDTGQVKPHRHPYDEVLAMFGTDWENPHELNAELEFWIEDEKHIITKSSIVFLPKGLQHGPVGFTRIDRPVFQFGINLGSKQQRNEEFERKTWQ